MTNDPTDSAWVPEPIRKRALREALIAVELVLREEGINLDPLAQCELLDVALDAITTSYDWIRPEPLDN